MSLNEQEMDVIIAQMLWSNVASVYSSFIVDIRVCIFSLILFNIILDFTWPMSFLWNIYRLRIKTFIFGLYALVGLVVNYHNCLHTNVINCDVIFFFLQASYSKEYGDMLREFKTTLKKVIDKNENKRIESHLE